MLLPWNNITATVAQSVGAAWIAGQDRSMWKTLRPSAGQAQHDDDDIYTTCMLITSLIPEGLQLKQVKQAHQTLLYAPL